MKGDERDSSSSLGHVKNAESVLKEEEPNPFENTKWENLWGTARLLGFHKMGRKERFWLRFLVIFCVLYIFFLDDIIWFSVWWGCCSPSTLP